MTLIQVAPIRVNPWSFIAKKARKILFGELLMKIEKVESEVSGIRKEMGKDRDINDSLRILSYKCARQNIAV